VGFCEHGNEPSRYIEVWMFLSALATISFQRIRTLLHGVCYLLVVVVLVVVALVVVMVVIVVVIVVAVVIEVFELN
jgi:hypothetical protein